MLVTPVVGIIRIWILNYFNTTKNLSNYSQMLLQVFGTWMLVNYHLNKKKQNSTNWISGAVR